MRNLGMSYDYMLEMGLADLHNQSKFWLSEIELWLIELSFFRKVIKRNINELKRANTEKETDHFIELIDFYRVRMLRKLKEGLLLHSDRLGDLLNGNEHQDEEQYRTEHRKIGKHIHTFEDEFKNLKKEFLDFIEQNVKEYS